MRGTPVALRISGKLSGQNASRTRDGDVEVNCYKTWREERLTVTRVSIAVDHLVNVIEENATASYNGVLYCRCTFSFLSSALATAGAAAPK